MTKKLRKGTAEPDPYPVSGRGLVYVCPGCGQPLTLHDTRDGDQAYWCHICERGHRAGMAPATAFRPEQAS